MQNKVTGREMRSLMLRCLILPLSFFALAAGKSRAAPDARLLDEKGKLVATVPTMWLAPGHLAIPAAAYQHFGLGASYDKKERRVYISIPETCSVAGYRAGGHRSYHPDFGYEPERSPYPLAKKRNGHFYVSVRDVETGFDYFTTTWDAATQQLTLKNRVFKDDAGEE